MTAAVRPPFPSLQGGQQATTVGKRDDGLMMMIFFFFFSLFCRHLTLRVASISFLLRTMALMLSCLDSRVLFSRCADEGDLNERRRCRVRPDRPLAQCQLNHSIVPFSYCTVCQNFLSLSFSTPFPAKTPIDCAVTGIRLDLNRLFFVCCYLLLLLLLVVYQLQQLQKNQAQATTMDQGGRTGEMVLMFFFTVSVGKFNVRKRLGEGKMQAGQLVVVSKQKKKKKTKKEKKMYNSEGAEEIFIFTYRPTLKNLRVGQGFLFTASR